MTLTPSERALITQVLMRGPITRAQLAAILDLSAPSLTRLSKRFLEAGVLVEVDTSSTSGPSGPPAKGRPRKSYDINADYGKYIGMKLTETEIYGALTDMRGNVLATVEHPVTHRDPERVADSLASAVQELAKNCEIEEIYGVGVALGGQVANRRVVLRNPFLEWRNVPLAQLLEKRVKLPVSIENDVVSLAEGAHLFGAAKGEPNFGIITVGAGVGYGLVLDDKVIASPDTGLGLGGHIPLDSTGPYCSRGHRGCSESLVTFGGMAAQYSSAIQRPATFEDFEEAVRSDQPAAVAILNASAEALGKFISIVANITMYPRVLLAGEGLMLWEAASDKIQAEIDRYRDPDAEPVELIVDDRGFDSWATGAAASALIESLDRLAPADPPASL